MSNGKFMKIFRKFLLKIVHVNSYIPKNHAIRSRYITAIKNYIHTLTKLEFM